MFFTKRSLLLFLALAGWHDLSSRTASADSVVSPLPCASSGELHTELRLRKDKLSKLERGLENFLKGGVTTDMPLSALFVIDLGNADAISQRVEALGQTLQIKAMKILPCLAHFRTRICGRWPRRFSDYKKPSVDYGYSF